MASFWDCGRTIGKGHSTLEFVYLCVFVCVCRGYIGKYVSLGCVSESLKVHSSEHKPTLCVCVCLCVCV